MVLLLLEIPRAFQNPRFVWTKSNGAILIPVPLKRSSLDAMFALLVRCLPAPVCACFAVSEGAPRQAAITPLTLAGVEVASGDVVGSTFTDLVRTVIRRQEL